MNSLQAQFGSIDVYWFDQILRGRVSASTRILDAGCGRGRNLVYPLHMGWDVSAVDMDAPNVAAVRALAKNLAPQADTDQFHVASVSDMPFDDGAFHVVLSCAVLHFAKDPAMFRAMLEDMFRVLAPDGLFFARLASSIGIEDHVTPLGEGRFRLPDGSDRFLVTEADLLRCTEELGGHLVDPIKTTNVQGLRCMSTWVVRKGAHHSA